MKKTQRCICPVTFTLEDEERIEWPDPECQRHGLRAGIRATPIYKYRRCKKHGNVQCRVRRTEQEWPDAMWNYECWAEDHYEDARETQQRLYRESVAA